MRSEFFASFASFAVKILTLGSKDQTLYRKARKGRKANCPLISPSYNLMLENVHEPNLKPTFP